MPNVQLWSQARRLAFRLLALAAVLGAVTAQAAGAVDPPAQDADAEGWALEQDGADVNEGALAFLPQPPARPVHHHHNDIEIDAASLRDGWVRLRQCHEHLDPVAASQVVYNAERTRALRIEAASGIGRAWVEGATVQLVDVGPGARLCVSAQTRALQRAEDGYYLRNGPYMRRFLDGYYPMHVTMTVRYPSAELQLVRVTPAAQPGVQLRETSDSISLDAWFEGVLETELVFWAREPQRSR